MRTIKFRYWNKIEKKMYYLELYQFKKEDKRFNEIMQFTGLKDKNGKEIYEGDINEDGYIISQTDPSEGSSSGMNHGWYAQKDDWEKWYELEIGMKINIVGNIYENPELLK